jgi:predicted ribosome quality control (RQC) complex YloA/Tae2 family protein
MSVDVFAVTAIGQELSGILEGARIDKIHMPAKSEVHLLGRSLHGSYRLLLSAHPQRARAHLSSISRENPQTPPMFCMLLRKHLTNGRFAGLYQSAQERVLHFYWDAADEMGIISRKTLVIEMIGRHSNIILVDAEGRIIDCLRRVDPDMSPERPVLPGLFYRDPPSRGVPPAERRMVWEGSVSEYLDRLYTQCDLEEQLKQKASSLTKSAKNNKKRVERKIGILYQELHDASNREHLREKADLLMANLHRIERGAETVEVEDFYHDNAPLAIRLDPTKTPQQNAAALYKSYAKMKTAETVILPQIERAEADAVYWESVLEQLSRVTNRSDLDEIRDEIAPVRNAKNPSRSVKIAQPMRFRSTEGVIFRAGRNNRQNDLLTMKMADRNDIWLHTQKIPGCHVIIEQRQRDVASDGVRGRKTEDGVGEQTLYEAAVVAAWFSSAKTSPKVPVDYTAVKYVKKPLGAKPGMVIYDKFKTLLVEPNEELVERLRAD